MRASRIVSMAVLGVCLLLPTTGRVFAGDAPKTTAKTKKKVSKTPRPAFPSGVPRPKADPIDAYYGGPNENTISEFRNELGQTVYSIKAAHFDVSPPLSVLAAAAPRQLAEGEDESPSL